MTVIYVTTGAWGTGTGTPNSAAEVDGNFHHLEQAVAAVEGALEEGKSIESVTSTSNSFTIHFTDDTSETIALPIATLMFVGEWFNSTSYFRGQMVKGGGFGIFQVLIDHTTAAAPATFNPNATIDGNPVYVLMIPLRDVNYDAAIFVPGSIQREPDELLFLGIANRSMNLNSGDDGAYAYLAVGNDSAETIIVAIERNGVEIGTITFSAGGDIDSDGGQAGVFNVPVTKAFSAGDTYSLRVTQSDNVEAAGMSITLPFIRTDI